MKKKVTHTEYTGSIPKCRQLKISKIIDNWIVGIFRDYNFEAKVYPIRSEYGINGGRISKLFIKRGQKTLFSYDRGFEHGMSADKIGFELADLFDMDKSEYRELYQKRKGR